jgi:hypothetical protein
MFALTEYELSFCSLNIAFCSDPIYFLNLYFLESPLTPVLFSASAELTQT